MLVIPGVLTVTVLLVKHINTCYQERKNYRRRSNQHQRISWNHVVAVVPKTNTSRNISNNIVASRRATLINLCHPRRPQCYDSCSSTTKFVVICSFVVNVIMCEMLQASLTMLSSLVFSLWVLVKVRFHA